MNKNIKPKLWIMIILFIVLSSCWTENNILKENNTNNIKSESSFDFSKYYSAQCPEGEIMTSWTEYSDWSIQVYNCVKPFSCPEWEEIISQCSSMIWDVPCKLYCKWKDIPTSEW